ncbi:DUF4221 family protein [Algoriphagus sp.]|uniref:DUF4221 family protein n=1 Tax=Algoriphagus sp. TaxID=1872435 RepID=UPI003F6F3BBE
MNKYYQLALVLLPFSCNTEKNTKNSNDKNINFSYSIDTVMIDAGDEFLFLNMNLYFSSYSADEGLLYNLNPESARMEVIDLESHSLDRLVQYDLDGPNRVKELAITGIKKSDTGDLFFQDYYTLSRLDSSGTKTATYRFTNDFLNGDELALNEEIDGMGQIGSDGAYFASFYDNYQEKGGIRGVAQIHLGDSSLRLFPLDFWGDLDKYEVNMDHGDGRAISAPEFKFLLVDGADFIVSTSAKNELWHYNAELDSIIHKEYTSEFTKNVKPGNYPKTTNNQEEFEQVVKQKSDEVIFGFLVKDENSGLFYRYSRERDNSKNNYAYVLTIFDENLNQLHEEKLGEEVSIPNEHMPGGKPFVHRGMLYSFLNIEDELAFVRLQTRFSDDQDTN